MRRTHAQIGCYMPRLAMRVLYVATPAYKVFKAPATAQSVRGYSKRPSLPIAPEAVQSVRGLSMRLRLPKAQCVLGRDLYSLQEPEGCYLFICAALHTQFECYMTRPAKRVLYVYIYICIYMYICICSAHSKRTRLTKRPRLFKASEACQCA